MENRLNSGKGGSANCLMWLRHFYRVNYQWRILQINQKNEVVFVQRGHSFWRWFNFASVKSQIRWKKYRQREFTTREDSFLKLRKKTRFCPIALEILCSDCNSKTKIVRIRIYFLNSFVFDFKTRVSLEMLILLPVICLLRSLRNASLDAGIAIWFFELVLALSISC